jgi:FkbM family methyltransferase
MNILSRTLRSLKDGSLPIKVLNRISRIKYTPSPESAFGKYLAERFPKREWERLSPLARHIWFDLSPLFVKTDIHNIAYVGAHDGKVTLAMDEAFPKRHFFLIEPVPRTFQKLVERVSSRPGLICLNIAAGAEEEIMDMFVDDFSAASSLMRYEEIAIQELPFLGKQETVKVQVRPLDDILQDTGAERIDMLVMDVQGYEDKVLQGAVKTLRSCRVVISELSLQPLYVGSSTFDSVYQALVREGFTLQFLLNPLKGASETILQIDGVFVRT